MKTISFWNPISAKKKGEFRRRSGRNHVNAMIRTRGEFELNQIYVGAQEIRDRRFIGNYPNRIEIKRGLVELAQRKMEESMEWTHENQEYNGWQAMENLLASNSITQKRGRRKKSGKMS